MHQPVKRMAEIFDKIDLALTVLAAVDLAVGAAIGGNVECCQLRPECRRHGQVEVFGQGFKFDGVRDGLKTRRRQQPLGCGHDPPDVGIESGQILRAVQIGQKECGGGAHAWARQKIGMGAG